MNKIWMNKRFRKNLIKWIIAYVAVIGLFTSVATYSKYVSSIASIKDTARVAKFIVEVDQPMCSNTLTKNCNKVERPTNIDYYFTVDSEKMEVSADLYINLYVDKRFALVGGESTPKLYEIVNDKEVLVQDFTKKNNEVSPNLYNLYGFVDNIRISDSNKQGKKKTYKLTIKYLSNNEYTEAFNSYYDMIKVGYSAIQVKTN